MTTELSRAVSSTNPKTHIAVSERARTLVKENFDIRGRFAHLEELSSISADQWRNFYYAKQRINEAMLAFLVTQFPDSKPWVLTGRHTSGDARTSDSKHPNFPFITPAPSEHECETIAQRLNWVIRQRVSDKGAKLFQYLSKISSTFGRTIDPNDWANVILGLNEPTLDMVSVICEWNSEFALWVILGPHRDTRQVDPSDTNSVASWVEWLEHRDLLAEVEGGIPSTRSRDRSPAVKSLRQVRKHGNKKG